MDVRRHTWVHSHSQMQISVPTAAPGEMALLWALLLLFLDTLSMTNSKVVLSDVNVTCLVHEDCLLPCAFRPTGSVVIHWYKQQIPVHSFYYNKDQFGLQNKHFSGRTSLFNSQIPQGNASLLLKRVKVQDKGRYKCYTSTRKGNQEVYINLDLKAHIQTVLLEMTDEAVTCSSSNIYPVPQLTWTTEPPSAQEALENATLKTTDHKGLFTVESTLRIVGNLSDFTYICSLTSADKMQVWTSSQKIQENIIQEEGQTLSIPCVAPRSLQNYSLVWTLLTSSYEPVVILRYNNRTGQTFNLWEGQAELDQDLVLIGDGSLLIHKPDTEEHSGIYTCVFSNDQGRHTVKTHVNITVAPISTDEQSVQRSRWSTLASVVFVLMVIVVALPQFMRQKEILTQTVSRSYNGAADVHKSLTATASYEMVQNGDGKFHLEIEEEIQIESSSESLENLSQETQKANEQEENTVITKENDAVQFNGQATMDCTVNGTSN